jgi:hypothetical protein
MNAKSSSANERRAICGCTQSVSRGHRASVGLQLRGITSNSLELWPKFTANAILEGLSVKALNDYSEVS